jgi:opacity protein-like surface antigen
VNPRLPFGPILAILPALFTVLLASRPSLAAEDGDEPKTEEAPDGAGSGDESKGGESKDDESKDDESKSDESKDDSKAKDEAFGHGGQIGARIGLVGGYRMILRYDDSQFCTDYDFDKSPSDQQKFCGHPAPFALSTGLSYGIADWLEPFAWGRFGLASEGKTDTEPLVMFGLGVRVYTMSDAPFKIFIEPAIGLEVEDGLYADYDTDVALHLAAGPTFDLNRHFGIYLTGGITTTVVRYLASSLEFDFGFQGRY